MLSSIWVCVCVCKNCHTRVTNTLEILIQGFSTLLRLVTLFIGPELLFLSTETGLQSSNLHYANLWEADIPIRMPVFSFTHTTGNSQEDYFAGGFFLCFLVFPFSWFFVLFLIFFSRRRERILDHLHTHCGDGCRAQSCDPEMVTWAEIKSRTQNWLSHPGNRVDSFFEGNFIWWQNYNWKAA